MGYPTFAAFIDFQKAYDSICYNILWPKLQAYGITGNVLKLIQNIYILWNKQYCESEQVHHSTISSYTGFKTRMCTLTNTFQHLH